MSEFDDRDLAERLRRLGGPAPDEAAAFAQVRQRVIRAKRRRAAAWTGGAAVMLLAVAGAYAAGARQPTSLQPATSDGVAVTTDASTAPTATTTDPATGVTTNQQTASTTTILIAPGSTVPGATVPGGRSAPTTSPTSTQPAPTTPSTTAAPTTSTFSGEGGSITVRLQQGTLTLLSTNPASGFIVAETRTESDRVEVQFESASGETRIRVDLVNGSMSVEVQEND